MVNSFYSGVLYVLKLNYSAKAFGLKVLLNFGDGGIQCWMVNRYKWELLLRWVTTGSLVKSPHGQFFNLKLPFKKGSLF